MLVPETVDMVVVVLKNLCDGGVVLVVESVFSVEQISGALGSQFSFEVDNELIVFSIELIPCRLPGSVIAFSTNLFFIPFGLSIMKLVGSIVEFIGKGNDVSI